FSIFDNENIIDFVQTRGVDLKEEDHGRMFPVTDRAMDVLDIFLKELAENNVAIRYNTIVEKILFEEDAITGVRLNDGASIQTSNLLIATGGKRVPNTSTTAGGHSFDTEAGHNITELLRTQVHITSSENFIKEGSLKGLSLDDVALSVLRKNGKPRITHQ